MTSLTRTDFLESEGDQIIDPTAMTIDQNTDHLYWIDAHYKTLHIMDFNGNNFALRRSSIHMISAWRMSLFGDRLEISVATCVM
jgi:hypothetical protein